MTGREIYDVMEQLNPTKQQEDKMYQTILSFSAMQKDIKSKGQKKEEINRNATQYGKRLRYAAAIILLLVFLPASTYAAFHSGFLQKFFDNDKVERITQDEEWLAQYVKENMGEFSYGGYLFRLRGYLMNSEIGEGMLLVTAKKERDTDYRLREMPEGEDAIFLYDDSLSMNLSEDEAFKNEDITKIIQLLPDGGEGMVRYGYECRKTGADSYEYRITLYSNYEMMDERIQQRTHNRTKPAYLNFYDGTGAMLGNIPLHQSDKFMVYHWLSPSGQNNVVFTPFAIYATGVPGQLLGMGDSKVIVTYRDGRTRQIEVIPLVSEYNSETYGKTATFQLKNIVNVTELESIIIHTKDREWSLDVENAQ